MTSNKKDKLNKQLNGVGVFSLASGAMISSGLFILPGLVYADVGPAVILAYILAGILVLPAIFSQMELTTAMPKAGGSYFFIQRSMGSIAGTIGGFSSWFSISMKSAFALVGIGAYVKLIFPTLDEWTIKLIVVGFCLFFTSINLFSVDLTQKIQNIMVFGLIALLVGYIVFGSIKIDVSKYSPFIKGGGNYRMIFAAAGMVFISYGGITKIASISEEVKNPVKNVPLGTITAFIIVLFLYIFTVAVSVGIIEGSDLANSIIPISDGGNLLLGTAGLIAMSIAAVLAFVSTANAGILSASRFLLAMSRDSILPPIFSNMFKKFKTPYIAIIFTGLFMIVMILLVNLETLVKIASTMSIFLFIMIMISSIIMRESKILNYKPTFKTPLYPFLQLIGIVFYLFLLYEMGIFYLLLTLAFVIGAVVWNRVYVRKGKAQNSAIIHIIKRLLPEDIAGESLSDELREILMERDQIEEDRFDKLVKECKIYDIEESISYIDFFKLISEVLSKKLNVEYDNILEKFTTREEESTTVLRPGLAIPHITIEGENKFEVIMARCEPGIIFSEDTQPVYAVFVLVGTKDERHFHLRALSAIAQVTQSQDFDKNWLRVRGIEDLRDLVLLSKRKRINKPH